MKNLKSPAKTSAVSFTNSLQDMEESSISGVGDKGREMYPFVKENVSKNPGKNHPRSLGHHKKTKIYE